MKMMVNGQDVTDLKLTHEHGGNGWVAVQSLDDNYYKVVMATKEGIGRQAFLAWGKKLKIETVVDPATKEIKDAKLSDETLAAANALRGKLASGDLVVVGTWIRPPERILKAA